MDSIPTQADHHPPPPLPPLQRPALLLHGVALSLLSIVFLLSPAPVSGDLFTLVYKGCANQTFYGAGTGGAVAWAQALSAVSSSLSSRSTTSKFYKTSASAGGLSLIGIFQCRGDLSPADCSACVARIFPMWPSLCGPAVAARVQLAGCLALYEASNFPQVPGTQLLYKTCGSGVGGRGDFETRRDTAFAQLRSGMANANQGFYATNYAAVYAMAQCEGDLSAGDCGECVSQAVQNSEVECGSSPFGQVYLSKCYISYNYYPGGAAHVGGGGGTAQTAKTVAIVVGAAAGVGFLVICLMFARNVVKNEDDL